jgi:hypothetical protein
MKFSEGDEIFYKVGHSSKVEERCAYFKKYYENVDILWSNTRVLSCKDVLIIERFLHKDLKCRKHKPLKYFGGSSECYTFLTPAFMRYYIRLNWHLIKGHSYKDWRDSLDKYNL